MKILAVSDAHGNLEGILLAVGRTRPDLTLCCGDWGDPGEVSAASLEAVLAASPVLSVYGNHDDVELLSAARNADGSHVLLSQGEVREFGGLRFAGISGIWAKSHRKAHYVTDEDVERLAAEIAPRRPDVLLSHGCPVGIADAVPGGRRGGQRCFLDAFHLIMPWLYLCGHLHAPQRRELQGGQVVVNVGYTCKGDYWVFEMNEESLTYEHCRL